MMQTKKAAVQVFVLAALSGFTAAGDATLTAPPAYAATPTPELLLVADYGAPPPPGDEPAGPGAACPSAWPNVSGQPLFGASPRPIQSLARRAVRR